MLRISSLATFLIFAAICTTGIRYYSGVEVRHVEDILGIALLSLCIFTSKIQSTPLSPKIKPISILVAILSMIILINSRSSPFAAALQIRNLFIPFSILLYYLTFRPNLTQVFHSIFICSMPLAFYGLVESISQHSISINQAFAPRIGSLVGSAADYGYILAILLIFFSYYLGHPSSRVRGTKLTISWLFLILLYLNLLLTYSRGAFVSLALPFVISSIVRPQKRRKSLIILLSATCIAAISLLLAPEFLLRFSNTYNNELRTLDPSLNEASRLALAIQSIPVFLDHPLFVVGLGNFGGWVAVVTNSPFHAAYDLNLFRLNSIDVFLPHFIAECGLAGIFILTNLMVNIFFLDEPARLPDYEHTLYSQPYLDHNKRYRIILFSFVMISSLFSMIPETVSVMMLYWVVAATIINDQP